MKEDGSFCPGFRPPMPDSLQQPNDTPLAMTWPVGQLQGTMVPEVW